MSRIAEQPDMATNEESDGDQPVDVGMDDQEASSEQRNVEEDMFTQWLASQQSLVSNTGRQSSENEDTVASDPATSPPAQIITTPREYQMQLFERAKERNTIVVLDTGMSYYLGDANRSICEAEPP